MDVLTNTDMTFDELRKRATAAELTLIDTVIKLMDEELTAKVKQRATKFLMANHPPSREVAMFDREAMGNWAKRFSEALEEVK